MYTSEEASHADSAAIVYPSAMTTAARVLDLVQALETIAPLNLAEEWDNVGLLVGDKTSAVTRVLLCIDYTQDVATERRAGNYQAVVAYHPVIFKALKRVLVGSLVYDAIRDGVAIYSPHTALDVADGGTNDVLGDALGLLDRTPLRMHRSLPGVGLGRVGNVEPIAREKLFERIKRSLGVSSLLISGPTTGEVKRAVCCAGACGDCVNDALASGADLYLTGELRHHDALHAAASGMTVVCALHSNSERATLSKLAERLRVALPSIDFVCSAADRDPFSIV